MATEIDPNLMFSLRFMDIVMGINVFSKKKVNVRLIFTLINMTVTGTLILLNMITNTGLDMLINNVENLPSFYQGATRILFLITYSNDFVNLVNETKLFLLPNNFESKIRDKVNKTTDILFKIVRYYYIMVFFVAMFFELQIFFVNTRIYPLNSYDICAIENQPCYYFMYVWVGMSVIFICAAITSCDMLMFCILIKVISQLMLISDSLESLKIDANVHGDEPEVLVKVVDIIKHHCLILEFNNKLNKLYSIILFYMLSAYIYILATSLYIVTTMSLENFVMIKYMLLIWAILLMTFVVCSVGEMIKEQTANIFEAAYNSNWYLKRHPKLTRYLYIMRQRTLKPDFILVAGIFELNRIAFMTIVRCATSFVTFMKTVAK